MEMIGHEHKRVELKRAFVAVVQQCIQEDATWRRLRK